MIHEQFDYVVIANVNSHIANALEKRLIKLGYNKKCIIKVDVSNLIRKELLSDYLNEVIE